MQYSEQARQRLTSLKLRRVQWGQFQSSLGGLGVTSGLGVTKGLGKMTAELRQELQWVSLPLLSIVHRRQKDWSTTCTMLSISICEL